jgi:glycyl-tRNA synthetase beta chain
MASAADFLVEIGTEELPPLALRDLMDAFAGALSEGLTKNHLHHEGVAGYASPRRLAALVTKLALTQEDRTILKKGPPVSIALDENGKPTNTGLSFAKKCGVEFSDLGREKNEKGEWLSYKATETGQAAAGLLPDIVTNALNALPIPRRMRWGNRDTEFVRPVHWILMLHGKNTVPGSVLGIESGNVTHGHRFHAPAALKISEPDKYLGTLKQKGYVIADFDVRREKIVQGVTEEANKLCVDGMAGSDDRQVRPIVPAATQGSHCRHAERTPALLFHRQCERRSVAGFHSGCKPGEQEAGHGTRR